MRDMTWGVILSIVLLSLIKLLMTCLPTGTVEWILSHFETHSKLNDKNVTLTIDRKPIEGKNKAQFIHFFNQAIFIEKYYIWPGTEQKYLNPENGRNPIIVETKRGKKNIQLFVFIYNDRVDVVKQYKKKLVAYSLNSDVLQDSNYQQYRMMSMPS